MLPHCSHITAKRGVYYFRRRLPRPRIGEVALSLRTANYRLAQSLAVRLNGRFIEILSSGSMSDSKLREILQQELARSLRDELKRHQETLGTTFVCLRR